MLKYAREYSADIVIAGFYTETFYKIVPGHIVNDVVILQGSESLMHEYLTTQFVTGLLWNKLYARELWKDVRFPLYRASEDNAVSYSIFDKCNKSIVIPNRFYHYVMRSDSVEHRMIISDHLISIDVAEERYNYISSKYPRLENAVNCNRWNIRVAMYKRLFMTNQQKKYKTVLSEWLDFFKHNEAPSMEYRKERNRILQHPYTYGYYIGCKYRLRTRIKKLLKKE